MKVFKLIKRKEREEKYGELHQYVLNQEKETIKGGIGRKDRRKGKEEIVGDVLEGRDRIFLKKRRN